jgi:CDP-paratose synthetase
MKIAIIGSTGFIGKNLYSYLKKNSNDEVLCFPSYLKHQSKWIKKITDSIKKDKPEIVINCSANQSLETSNKNFKDLLNSNLYANIEFISQCLRNKKFKSYISFGTKWELDNTKHKKILNFYAASKKANDIFFEFFSNNKTSLISLKIFDTYGPNDKRKKLLNDLLSSYKRNLILKITSGYQYLDYVHIDELCSLLLKIINDIKLNKLKGFNSFTVSSKKPIRLINLINKLKKILDKDLKVNIGAKKYRIYENMGKPKNIFNYPGWKLKYNLLKELKKIFDEK